MQDIHEIENMLMENLVPILGLDGPDAVSPDSALVEDLGAESIDYVEIVYMIENEFGVKIKLSELMLTGSSDGSLPEDGKLTAELAASLNAEFDSTSFAAGQSPQEVFNLFTVHNLAFVIQKKMQA